MLACVAAVGNAEAEVEVEALEQLILKEVPLDHAEARHGAVADCELHPGTGSREEHGNNAEDKQL